MFRLRTLGGLSVADGLPRAAPPTQRRRLALLALLAVARERGMSRDKLLGYLWPESDSEHARHALSQALYGLRQEFGDGVLIATATDLALDPAVMSADVWRFDNALDRGDPLAAVQEYGGVFLDGFFLRGAAELEHWLDAQRDRLARAYGRALETLAATATRRGTDAEAVEWLRRRAAHDPLSSQATMRLMDALAASGERAEAAQYAREHAALVRRELGMEPDPTVTALAASLAREVLTPVADGRPVISGMRPERLSHAQFDKVGADGRGQAVGSASTSILELPLTPWRERGGSRPASRRLVAVAACSAALLLAIGGIAARWRQRANPPPVRTIMLGSISGPDSILSAAVSEALRAEMHATEEVRVVSEAAIRETLHLMSLPAGTPLTEEIARGIAQRRGVQLVLIGSATPLGTGSQLVAQLLDASSGASMFTVAERPERAAEVIPAVTRLVRAVRAGAGTLRRADSLPALPAITTASLTALRNYVSAQQAVARLDRQGAIALLEAAVIEDSSFALGHYMLGDLLWYVDQQRHSEAHLSTAHALSGRLPTRERLVIRARYEQLVRDEPDSAMTRWRQLRTAYPDEAQALQGMLWATQALGRTTEYAALADTAFRLEPGSIARIWNKLGALLGLRQFDSALAFARAIPASQGISAQAEFVVLYSKTMTRHDWGGALALVDSTHPPLPNGLTNPDAAVQRQVLLLALGRLPEAAKAMEVVVSAGVTQYPVRALLHQAQAEARAGSPSRARALSRRAFAWLVGADISPPAVARLSERIADASARSGDVRTVEAVGRLLSDRDGGRRLRSYALARLTVDACAAYARGDMRSAAWLAGRSGSAMFFGRSRATVAMVEADARAAAGDRRGADSVYRLLLTMDGVPDGDHETAAVLHPHAARALAEASPAAPRAGARASGP